MSINNEWDNIIKDKLGAFEEAPPAYMWDKIASGIPAASAKVVFYKTTLFKISAVAATIILLLGFGWMWSENNIAKPNNNELLTNTIEQNNNSKNINNYNDNSPGDIKIEEKVAIENSNPQVDSKNENEAAGINISSHTKSQYNTHKQSSEKNTQEELANTVSDNSDVSVTGESNNSLDNNTHPKLAAEISSSEIASTHNSNSSAENVAKADIISQKESSQERNNEITTKSSVVVNKKSVEVSKEDEEQALTQFPLVKTLAQEEDGLSISPEEIPNSFQPRYRSFNRIGIGAHYGIESIQVNDKQLLSNNIDLSFTFQNLNLIMQSGIGIQFSKDIRDYDLEYLRNDYLATEMRFDSAVFVMDSLGNVNLVPVDPYYTDVYDSIHHTHNASYYEKYYSLRIPVMIGYQKDYKNIGLFAKGGIFYSRVIYKQKTAIYEPDESSRMIQLNYEGTERVSNQIQYVFAAGFAYRFNKNLQFTGEIMTKYYQNSLYDNPAYSNTNPWSAEGRVGLIYFIN